jgi:PHD/YefM family antitoxin component YafN of YafNO toxin-antitoxin module
MKGIQFLVDEKGEKSAVLIDLKRYSELWEDFYDQAIARSRQREPRESLESVRKRLMRRKPQRNG